MYKYTTCGLSNVYLANGYKKHKTPYGEGISIEDVEGLHRVIADCLVNDKPFLTGTEFKFLRKEMDMSQPRLGRTFGVSAQAVAKWEKSSRVPKWGDHWIRALYREYAHGNAEIRKMIDELNDLDRQAQEIKLAFGDGRKGWGLKAA